MKNIFRLGIAATIALFALYSTVEAQYRFRTYPSIDSTVYVSQTRAIRFLSYNGIDRAWADVENYSTLHKLRFRVRDNGTHNPDINVSLAALSTNADSTYAEVLARANGSIIMAGRRPTGSPYQFFLTAYMDSVTIYNNADEKIRFSDHQMRFTGPRTGTVGEFDIEANTTDGADTMALALTGGGNDIVSRGAIIKLNGNEFNVIGPTPPGGVGIFAGDVSTGDILFLTGFAVERFRVTNSGVLKSMDTTTTSLYKVLQFFTDNDSTNSYFARELSSPIGLFHNISLRVRDYGNQYPATFAGLRVMSKAEDSTYVYVNANGNASFQVGGRRKTGSSDANWIYSTYDSTAIYVAGEREVLVNSTGVTVDGTLSASNLTSGTYTPTLFNVENVSASTAVQCQYMRVGDRVTVSGRVTIDPTTTTTLTRLGISLPIASNIGNNKDCGGTAAASGVVDNPAAIIGDAINNRAELSYICLDVTNHNMFFTFMYSIY